MVFSLMISIVVNIARVWYYCQGCWYYYVLLLLLLHYCMLMVCNIIGIDIVRSYIYIVYL